MQANKIVGHIITETKLHVTYCESFNISLAEMQATEEHQGQFSLQLSHIFHHHFAVITLTILFPQKACTAYTRYVLDVGQSDWLALQVAMAPCLLGYFAIADMLSKHKDTRREGNTYWPWIENYVAEDYTEAVRLGSGGFFSFPLLTR